MAANCGAIDHVLPVVSQAKADQCFQKGIPNAVLSPSPETDIDRIPFAVSLVHIPPRASDAQYVQHPI